MMKKAVVLGASIVCGLSVGYDAIISSAQDSVQFRDTEQHWAQKSIQAAVDKEYVDGYEDGTFKPDAPISRAEFIKMVALATGEKINHVEGEGWFRPYVERLKEQGVIPAEFPERYNEPMQRIEMSVVSVRSVNKNLKGSMMESTGLGLIHGVSKTDLDMYGTSTRAQAITIIERMLAARKGDKLPVDKYAASAAEISETGSNVKTMLGLTPKEIGTTWTWSEGVTVRMNQLIVADPADPDDPYMRLIDMTTWGKSTSKTENKVILANFTVVATEAGVGAPDLLPLQVLKQLDTSDFLLLTDQELTGWMRFLKPQTHEGYVAYALPNKFANRTIMFDILGKHITLADR
ncbi:S-layer homology domain-containing protein [Bacillus sp. 3255]|uniref:S-layer homology domain-containing protein n=1 Tax=Bacillus sp. 3255 TaxID=2817904 RepID=UPI00285C5544|nr:S-layer homology domain-containing protein [Bacillus sp. 3255]MDR6878884.1 hypothetical protein [Bacillus sp. 3255]